MAHPLEEYTEAVEAYHKGERDIASHKLSNAFGASSTLKVVSQSLERLVSAKGALSDAILRLLVSEERKRG